MIGTNPVTTDRFSKVWNNKRNVSPNIKYLENITWKGGEVFLYKKFLNLLKIASDNHVKQTIITNGLLLNEEINHPPDQV